MIDDTPPPFTPEGLPGWLCKNKPTTDNNPDRPKASIANGCLFGVLCGIVGSVSGCYWGFHLDMQGPPTVDNWIPFKTIAGTLVGGLSGWLLGWLLIALRRGLPQGCTIVAVVLAVPLIVIGLIVLLFGGT